MKLFLLPFFIGYVYGHQNQDFNNLVNAGPGAQPHIHTAEEMTRERQEIPLWDKYGNHDFMHDLNHLKEEANKVLYMQKTERITSDESAFLYTKLHDFNSDGKLDGLELLLAVRHSLVHHNSTFENIELEKLSVYVDSELNLMDLNNDGFVDYGEIYTYMESNKINQQNQQNQGNQQNQQPIQQ